MLSFNTMAPFSLVLLLVAVSPALSARIAGVTGFGGAQYILMRLAMEELASRGHEVTLVVSSALHIKPSKTVSHTVYKVPQKPGFTEMLVKTEIDQTKLKYFFAINEVQREWCDCLLNSTEILQQLKNFDLIVYESLAFCAVLVGELWGIPRVEIYPTTPSFPFGIKHMKPMPVSYVPQLPTGFSDKMTFVQRLVNLGVYVGITVFQELVFDRTMDALKHKYNIRPEKSYKEAVGDAELVIITSDFVLEYPQPLLPGQVMVGSLTVKAAKPLPPDLEKFVSSSGGSGFIIVSFGSNVASTLSKARVDMLATAFGKLKQKVLWRLKGYIPSFLGPNIKAVDWLPQNDLLGHKKIRAFFSHAGHNGFYESVYHGVPLVAFPLFADQHATATKIEYFEVGLAVDPKKVTSEQLFETIERVIDGPRFKANAVHLSKLLRDHRRTPLEETGDWIEYVIRHGGARHLRAQVFNIPWYQYYLLDIVAFLVAMVILVVMVIRLTCKCLCFVCCQKNGEKAKKE